MPVVVGVFDYPSQVEQAILELKSHGYTSRQISVVSKGSVLQSDFLGAMSALAVPGLGPVVGTGLLTESIAQTRLGTLSEALIEIGIDEGDCDQYEEAVSLGQILCTVDVRSGQEEDVAKVLCHYAGRRVGVHRAGGKTMMVGFWYYVDGFRREMALLPTSPVYDPISGQHYYRAELRCYGPGSTIDVKSYNTRIPYDTEPPNPDQLLDMLIRLAEWAEENDIMGRLSG